MTINPTKIDWCTHTWNFIHGCNTGGCFYCYAQKLAQRWSNVETKDYHWLDQNGLHPFTPMYNPVSLNKGIHKLKHARKPMRIFIGSMGDILSDAFVSRDEARVTSDDILYMVSNIARENQMHTFILLSKRPERYTVDMPKNVWMGTSIDSWNDQCRNRVYDLIDAPSNGRRWLSIEPLLDPAFHLKTVEFTALEWIVVGGLSQGNIPERCRNSVDWIIEKCSRMKIPIFVKDNLIEQFQKGEIGKWPQELF